MSVLCCFRRILHGISKKYSLFQKIFYIELSWRPEASSRRPRKAPRTSANQANPQQSPPRRSTGGGSGRRRVRKYIPVVILALPLRLTRQPLKSCYPSSPRPMTGLRRRGSRQSISESSNASIWDFVLRSFSRMKSHFWQKIRCSI